MTQYISKKGVIASLIGAAMVLALVAVMGATAHADTVVTTTTTVTPAATVFTRDLTVGRTGADVMALQKYLNANGYTVASTGAGSVGNESSYFGALTRSAVARLQAANNISPAAGYFGPLTRAFVNANAGVATGTPAACPAGFTCTPLPGTTVQCPAGYTCVPANGSGSVANDGTNGSVIASQSSYVSSGTQLNKGDTKDVAAIRLQAIAGPVTVNSVNVDFSVRPWLFFSQITLHDSNGNVIATKQINGPSDSVEVSSGTDYLVQFSNLNYVVNTNVNPDLAVGVTVLSSTDKITSGQTVNVGILANAIRTTNGQGYVSSVGGASSLTATQPAVGLNTFTFGSNSANKGDIYARISPSTPPTRIQTISTTQTTSAVVLGTFSLKSTNVASTLNSLTAQINSNATDKTLLFSNARLISGSTNVGGVLNSNGSVTFSNLNLSLPQDSWQDVNLVADVIATSTSYTASSSLVANSSNIVATDANYNTSSVETATSSSNNITLSTTGVSVTNTSVSDGGAIVQNNYTVGYNETYSFTLNNTSNNEVYVSKTPGTLVTLGGTNIGTSSLPTLSVTNPTTYAGDTSSSYDIPAGTSRTFTLSGAIRGNSGTTVQLKVTAINYGISDGANAASSITFGLDNLTATKSF